LIVLTTEHRPAPLPNRAAPPDAVRSAAAVKNPARDPETGQRLLPAGASHFAKQHYAADGTIQVARHSVPVNDCGQISHIEFECMQCPGSGRWVSAKAKIGPLCLVHDQPMTPVDPNKRAPWFPPVPWDKVWDCTKERVYVAAATATVAGVGYAADGADLPWYGEAAQFSAVPAVVAGSWWLTRYWLTRQAVKRHKLDPADQVAGARQRRTIGKRARHGAYLAAAVGAWVELTDVVGVAPLSLGDWPIWLSLAGVGIVGTRPYLRWADKRRADAATRPAPVPEPAVDAAPHVDPGAARDAADWAATVAVTGGLVGTVVDVSTWKADPGGRSMVIRNDGRRGALTEEKLRQALPLIAGAFDVSLSAIGWVTEHEGSPNAARLLVQPNSPLNDIIPGEPVDILPLNKAVAHMGKRMDGTPLVTRLFTPGWGAPSRVIIGTKGSGKTELIRRLMLVMLKARIDGTQGPKRLVAPFLHDPKRGADYGAFRRQVCGFSIASDTLHMIVEAFSREMDRRYDALAGTVWTDAKGREREGERPFDPYTMGPILSLTADEFHIDAKDAALMAKLDLFGRKMRAAGIEVNFATHLSTIGDTGSQGFRDMCAGGEAWLLRTTLGLNAALATGGTLNGDPRLLPRVPGMVLQASGEDITMQARVAYDDPEALYDLLYNDDNQSLIQPIEWPQETLDAFGPDMVEWMRASQERPLGSSAVAAPAGYRPSGTPDASPEDRKALDALLEILAGAAGPMRRPEIMADSRWSWATKTLTNCLRAGQDVDPQLLEKVEGSNGAYRLTPFGSDWARLEGDRKRAILDEKVDEGAE
jgi:hypothetical protein